MRKQLHSNFSAQRKNIVWVFYRVPNMALKNLLTTRILFILCASRNVQKATKFFWGAIKPESSQSYTVVSERKWRALNCWEIRDKSVNQTFSCAHTPQETPKNPKYNQCWSQVIHWVWFLVAKLWALTCATFRSFHSNTDMRMSQIL